MNFVRGRVNVVRPSLLGAALVAGLVALGGARSTLASQATPRDPRTIPLVDQSGATFRLDDLAGKPTVVTFVASRCTDACPIANALFLRTYKRLQHDRVPARLLTVTLDPAHDTPAVMARLAKSFGVPRDGWRFVSGRPADVRALMRSFDVEVQPDAHGIPEEHSSYVYVLDRDVRIDQTLLLSTDLTNEVEAALRPHAAPVAR